MRALITILAVLIVIVGGSALGADYRLVYVDSIIAADSNAIRHDTSYSGIFEVLGRHIQFGTGLYPYLGYSDTNWGSDTFFVSLQSSFDRKNWVAHAIDTAVDTGYQVSTVLLDRDATVIGNWGRIMLIHRDSIGTGEADSALIHRGEAFRKEAILYLYSY